MSKVKKRQKALADIPKKVLDEWKYSLLNAFDRLQLEDLKIVAITTSEQEHRMVLSVDVTMLLPGYDFVALCAVSSKFKTD